MWCEMCGGLSMMLNHPFTAWWLTAVPVPSYHFFYFYFYCGWLEVDDYKAAAMLANDLFHHPFYSAIGSTIAVVFLFLCGSAVTESYVWRMGLQSSGFLCFIFFCIFLWQS